MKKLLMGLMLTVPMMASAVEIDVTETACGLIGGPPVCEQMRQAIIGAVNADIPNVSIDTYGTGIANSTAFSMKGQGSDYTDNFDLFTIKGSAGVAVSGKIDNIESAEGLGLGASLTVGLNMDILPVQKIGDVELKDFDIFMSLMSYSLDQELDKITLEGKTNSLGLHVRWRFLEGEDYIGGHIVEWGGVHVHTGIQTNNLDISAEQSFDDQTASSNGQTATFSNSKAKFDIESQSTSIPLEISTNIRLLYVLTFYTGVGLDYTIGKTDVDLNASGLATVTTGGGYSANINANETGSGDADAFTARAFLGAQFNIPLVKVYVHANKGLGNDLLGANAGVKLTW